VRSDTLALLVAAGLAAGCAELLPKAHTELNTRWHSFAEARTAIERIVPNRTTVAELRAEGIDPYVSANVQVLNYSDIVLRFPIGGSVAPERLDPGLRRCLEAGKACTGYSISVRDIRHDRVGDFWLDALNFRRVVESTGWSFNALILMVDDRVVYTLHGGQPAIHEIETMRQPLGPLQGWGDALPGLMR
jgi:hypothetical protein